MALARLPGRAARVPAWRALWIVLPLAAPTLAAANDGGGVVTRGAGASGHGDRAPEHVDAPATRGGDRPGRPSAAARRAPPQVPPSDTLELLVVSPRPWTSAVAVTLSLAGGHGDDPPGREGAAWLLGMVLERAANANLAETGASAQIEVVDDRTWVTLLATSSDWARAYEVLTRTLVADPLDPELSDRARADLSGQVFFQRDAPVRTFEREARRMLLGEERARAPMGTPSSVSDMTTQVLEAARARIHRLEGARVAVVGPVAPADAASVVGAHRTLAWRARDAWEVEGAPLPPRAPGWAWEEGGRTSVADDITNNWILATYPFAGATPRRPMEFLAHLIGERLATNAPAPGLISQRAEVRELPGGPVLAVTVAAEWPNGRAWEQRVADIVDDLSANPLRPDDVTRAHRRFRATRALALANPEREGRRLLVEVEANGELAELRAPPQGLSPEGIRRAAADLGQPRVLVHGPGEPP